MKPFALGALAAALAGCAAADLPRLGVLPAFKAEIEDRVWQAEGPGAAPGAIRVFLSDGTMLTASCDGPYALSPWRRANAATLAWEVDGAVVRAEIAAIGPATLALLADPEGAAEPLTFRRAEAPVTCADPAS